MAVKTLFSENELTEILSNYELGEFQSARPFEGGSVQTNFLLQTIYGKFAFRYYENRSKNSVLFETNLTHYLKTRNYPCPAPIKNKHGRFVGLFAEKPYVIFEFLEGHYLEHPNADQKDQFIQKVAELQILTKHYKPRYQKYRWNYTPALCRKLAANAAQNLNTDDAHQKLAWLETELSNLQLPASLPKGICHCDFHFSNVLFKDGKFNALIDFDDANYTYLMFDLVGLISTEAWRYGEDEVLNFKQAKAVTTQYARYRSLNPTEKRHLFDLFKLSILFDCIWYFSRGNAEDFYEKRKIDFLNEVGRENFYKQLFT